MACTYPYTFTCPRGEFDENDVGFCDGCEYDPQNPCSGCDWNPEFCSGCADWDNWFLTESPWRVS